MLDWKNFDGMPHAVLDGQRIRVAELPGYTRSSFGYDDYDCHLVLQLLTRDGWIKFSQKTVHVIPRSEEKYQKGIEEVKTYAEFLAALTT